jgi:four helix bundle protein
VFGVNAVPLLDAHYAILPIVHKYRSLAAWQHAHRAIVLVHRETDRAYRAIARPLFEQLRRAAISVEANIVEGYALGSSAQFARHLRIAMGSAAEAECLIRLAVELEFLSGEPAKAMEHEVERAMAALTGLLRKAIATKSLTGH